MESADSFISLFPNSMTFIPFSCLIALAKNTTTISGRSSKRGHPCLDPHLKRKVFSVLPLSLMSVVGCFLDILH